MHFPREGQLCVDFFGLAVDLVENGDALIAHVTSRTDPHELALARKLFRPGMRVLVAGNGYGGTAALLAMTLGVENVVAYEPDPGRCRLVAEHVRVSGKPLQVERAALSATNGSAGYYASTLDWPTSSLSSEWAAGDTAPITVPVIGIRTAIATHRINALLLDVEGEEGTILEVMPWRHLHALVIELHGDEDALDRMTHQVARGMNITDRIDGERTRILGAVRQTRSGG